MSYDVYLTYSDGSVAKVEAHYEGDVIQFGGSESAWLDLTWNYSLYYYLHLDALVGIRWLHGKTGSQTHEALRQCTEAIERMTHEDYNAEARKHGGHALDPAQSDDDYWKPTPEHAARAVRVLAQWALEHPDAVWNVD